MQAYGLYTHIAQNRRRSLYLLACFALVFAAVFYSLCLLAASSELHTNVGRALVAAAHMFRVGLPWAILPVGLWFVIAFFSHQNMIDYIIGSAPLDKAANPQVYAALEELCISRGLATPSLRVMDSPGLNAFASGLRKDACVVTVTRGLIETLTPAELKAVLAHEITHIRNSDAQLLTFAAVFVGVLAFVFDIVLRGFGRGGDSLLSSRSSRSNSDSDGSPLAAILAIVILAVSVGVTVAIQAALARQREFLADSGSVELTKDPDALISALTKIGENPTVPHAPISLTAFFIATPHKTSSRRADILDSHPPIQDRIEALVKYAGGRMPKPAALPSEPAPDAELPQASPSA